MILEALNSINGNQHHINRYFKFIERCKTQTNEGYTEGHHILPRSLFKEHECAKWNIVELSARQHFVAHIILAKAYGGPMWAALHMMAHCDENGKRDYRVSSRVYNTMKGEYSKALSVKMSGSGNPMFGRDQAGENNPMFGRTHSEESIAKQRQARIEYFCVEENRLVGEKNGMFGKTHTDEFKQRKSESMLGDKHHYFGKTRPPEAIEKQRASMTGRVLTDEHKDKMSKALKGKKKPESHGKNVAAAKIGKRKVWTTTSFIWVHKDDLSKYFFRDGKYYNYDVL